MQEAFLATSRHRLHGHVHHIYHVIYFIIKGEHIRKERAFHSFSSAFQLYCSFSLSCPVTFPLLPCLCQTCVLFPDTETQCWRWQRGFGTGEGWALVQTARKWWRILSSQLHGIQDWIKVLSNLCVWHHQLISYYKIKCYYKISATVKASLPLPVLNWDFKSGTVYTGYFPWHVYQYFLCCFFFLLSFMSHPCSPQLLRASQPKHHFSLFHRHPMLSFCWRFWKSLPRKSVWIQHVLGISTRECAHGAFW